MFLCASKLLLGRLERELSQFSPYCASTGLEFGPQGRWHALILPVSERRRWEWGTCWLDSID